MEALRHQGKATFFARCYGELCASVDQKPSDKEKSVKQQEVSKTVKDEEQAEQYIHDTTSDMKPKDPSLHGKSGRHP